MLDQDREVTVWNLTSVVHVLGKLSTRPVPVTERREALLRLLGELLHADARYWAWGRGHPARGKVVPLALIQQGFTPEQIGRFVELAMDPRSDHYTRLPFLQKLAEKDQVVIDPRLAFSDDEWESSAFYREQWAPIGFAEMMSCVRYCAADTWTQVMFMRKPGVGRFSDADRSLLSIVMANVPWLDPGCSETVPPEQLAVLSERQRGVMLLLLDGLSRKQIADALFISEHTVGDHIKAIYKHFGVNSVGQLAAQFLRNAE